VNFDRLISTFSETHVFFQKRAFQSVNRNLTLRNWLFGFYIVEYEQNGEERATYGNNLLQTLANELAQTNLKGLSFTNLNIFRQFYIAYPHIMQTVSAKFKNTALNDEIPSFLPTLIQNTNSILQTVSEESVSSKILIERLTFSHFAELLKCETIQQRQFYEIETIKGTWSVRELKRQMNSLLFERTGLSVKKETLLNATHQNAISVNANEIIKDPYFFEFLGLKPKDVFTESELETALLSHIQEFLLELGKGFLFEARQKRILIGDEYFKIDLVFYHRILKCHVLIELKTREFRYSDVTQLNVYLNYYKKHELIEGENPPIGILLCTNKNEALVEFATDGIENQLFISKYKLALPTKEELKAFMQNELKKI